MNFKTYENKTFLVEANETVLVRANDLSKPEKYTAADTLPAGRNIGDTKILPKRTEVRVSAVKANDARTAFAFVTPVDASKYLPAGWTKAFYLEGQMANEIVGLSPSDWVLPPQDKNFTVTDGNALVRSGPPDFKKMGAVIPKNTFVVVTQKSGEFVRVRQGSVADGQAQTGDEIGWTAVSNLTEGWSAVFATAEWADTKGPNSCWGKGKFIGNRILANIIGAGGELEQVTLPGLAAYLELVEAAAKKNLSLQLNSGFRTFQQQERLFLAFQQGRGNLAARPGSSNHQHGQAFDLNTGGFDGHPIYDWLKKNGPKFGFIRTVNKEHWHWEYRPSEAAALAARGEFKLPAVRT